MLSRCLRCADLNIKISGSLVHSAFIALTFYGFCEYFHHHRINGAWNFPNSYVRRARADITWLGGSMVELLNLKKWIILPILCLGFILTAWIRPTCAAQLKDIRVGEYETHTRIVFELSGPDSHEKISPLESGQLSVLFSETDLELIRKIPIDRSKHLKEIKIWQRQAELSLILSFDFEHFRYELSKLRDPIRIVLDVYRLSAPVASQQISPVQSVESVAADKIDMISDEPGQRDPSSAQTDGPIPSEEALSESTSVQLEVEENHSQEPVEDDLKTQIVQETAIKQEPVIATPSETLPEPTVEQPQQTGPPDGHKERVSGSKKLQHYLAVALVILTLIILVLLLIMLVLKNRWVSGSSFTKPGELLERQDRRIAALDAKIQEQLKQFDKV